MKIDLTAIRNKLAAERVAKEGSTGTQVATTPTPAPTTTEVIQQLSKMAMNIPADDPRLSPEENYLRQASATEVQQKIQDLADRLAADHPSMPVLLKEIHSTLKQQPDNVTLLSDEQIGVIVSGLLRYTNTTISTTKRAKKKAPRNLSLADLGF